MKTVLAVVVVAAMLAIVVRTFEARFAFFPFTGETTTPRDLGIAFEPLTLATSDGERLRAWALRPEDRREDGREDGSRPVARASVLYFHGNGGNLSVWAPILVGVARQGYSVFAVDYRGYGLSTGRPSEQGLYRDVDAAVARFWSLRPLPPVVYWGRSLGGSMASYAATVRAPDGIILESTFPDVSTLVRASPLMAILALFSRYRFPAAAFLQRLADPRPPVLILHGDRDELIGIGQGRALFDRIREPKRFVAIQGGEHNDLTPSDAQTYWAEVARFVEELRPPLERQQAAP
jgi:fermentation-respiration switch protein FrsA (DUF1100 family)